MPLRVQASSVKTAVAGSMYDSDLCQVSTVAAAVAMCFFDTAHSACVLHKFRRRRRRRRSRLLSPWHGQRHRINTRHKPDTRTAYSPCVCVCVCARGPMTPNDLCRATISYVAQNWQSTENGYWTSRGCHRRLCVLSFRSFGGICETASCPITLRTRRKCSWNSTSEYFNDV